MKFVCTQEKLLQGLARVTPLAGRNRQLPILEHVLLQLKEGLLHVTCTDLEIGVHTTIPGKVESEGSCTTPARKILEYVQQLPSNHPLTCEITKKSLRLTTTGFTAEFPVAAADDFPLLPQTASTTTIELPAAQLCAGLHRTLFAAARDETRPEIHSVFVRGEDKTLTLAATDSFRLGEELITIPDGTINLSLLLPLATAQEIVRLFADYEQVKITPHDTHLTVATDDLELSSRLVDGRYPDYQQIIPQQFATTSVVSRDELMRALKTLLVFLPRDSRRVHLTVNPSKEEIKLAVGGSENGQGDVELSCSGSGSAVDILFNIQYLLEGLQHLDGDEVQLQLVSATEPAVLTSTEQTNKYRYVVMPIQA